MRLRSMTEEEFARYLTSAVSHYADEHVKSGRWDAGHAQEQAEREFQELLPHGLNTVDQFLFTLVDEVLDEAVGMLWYGIREKIGTREAWIWDFSVTETVRRRGYGRQALDALEGHVRQHRLDRISLHVFGHNTAARALYERMGYEPVNIVMSKALTV